MTLGCGRHHLAGAVRDVVDAHAYQNTGRPARLAVKTGRIMPNQSKTLVGTYVDLRPISVDDAALTLRWRHADRARYLNKVSKTVEEQSRWIKSRPLSEYNFIIQLKAGTPVGMLSLVGVDHDNHHAETGRVLIC